MIELLDGHVLDHKFPRRFTFPVITDDRVSDFFPVEVSFKEHEVELIQQELFLLFQFLIQEQAVVSLWENLEYGIKELVGIFLCVLDGFYPNLKVLFFSLFLQLIQLHSDQLFFLSLFFQLPVLNDLVESLYFLFFDQVVQLVFFLNSTFLHFLQ